MPLKPNAISVHLDDRSEVGRLFTVGEKRKEFSTQTYTEKNSETRRCLEDVSKTDRRTGVSKLRRTGVSKYQGCLKNYEALAGLKTETRWRLISVSKASRKL